MFNSCFPAIPVDSIKGIFVSANAFKRGRLVKSRLATFRKSGENNFKTDKHLIEHKVSVMHCIWEKTNPSPMNCHYIWLSSIENCVYGKKSGAVFYVHCKSAVWRNPIELYKDHTTPKPVKLISRLIEASLR